MVAAMASIASMALPPSASMARPASAADRWGAATAALLKVGVSIMSAVSRGWENREQKPAPKLLAAGMRVVYLCAISRNATGCHAEPSYQHSEPDYPGQRGDPCR